VFIQSYNCGHKTIRPNNTTHDKQTNSNIQCNEQTTIKQKWRKFKKNEQNTKI